MGLLTGKTALITGAARGIGKAIALKFASEGANIAFTDLVLNDDMAAGLEATRKEIEAVGVTCRAYAGNAADFAETENVVKQIREDFGSIDILVNNVFQSAPKSYCYTAVASYTFIFLSVKTGNRCKRTFHCS